MTKAKAEESHPISPGPLQAPLGLHAQTLLELPSKVAASEFCQDAGGICP